MDNHMMEPQQIRRKSSGSRKKKRRRRRMLQKLIPVIVALVLIAVVLGVSLSTGLLQQFAYSTERADQFEYFSVVNSDDVAIITNDELTDRKAKLYDGRCYFSYDMVTEMLFDRFYFDERQDRILYTTATDVISIPIDGTQYFTADAPTDAGYVIAHRDGDQIYIALDYLQQYANFSYHLYEGEPYHMDFDMEWGTNQIADIAKKDHVRTLGGIKSPILTDVNQGDTVTILNQMEEWCEVKTADGYIGYIENKRLENFREEAETPVTTAIEETYPNISKDYPINLVWHQVTNADANNKLEEMMEGTSGITTISPTWFFLKDNEGNFDTLADKGYVDRAHAMGMEVWALVDDFTNSVDTYEIFSYSEKRANLISQLIAAAKEYDLDGLNIDFEKISSEAGPHYVQFLRELSIQCRSNQIVLSVDNYVPREHTSHYNRKEQGRVVDYVIIMGYDEHYAGSTESGSVASIGFVKDGIEQTLAVVPAEKVINALPFYTRIWIETPKTEEEAATEDPTSTEYIPYHLSSDSMSMQGAADAVAKAGAATTWDEVTMQNYAEYQKEGATYRVWLEDVDSITAKMQAVQSYQIAGVAGWKLGLEDKNVWSVIAQYLN